MVPGHPVLGQFARPHREVRRAGVAVGGVHNGCRQSEDGGGLGGRGRPRSRVGDAAAREHLPAGVAGIADRRQGVRRSVGEGSEFVVVDDEAGQCGDEPEGGEPVRASGRLARKLRCGPVGDGERTTLDGDQNLWDREGGGVSEALPAHGRVPGLAGIGLAIAAFAEVQRRVGAPEEGAWRVLRAASQGDAAGGAGVDQQTAVVGADGGDAQAPPQRPHVASREAVRAGAAAGQLEPLFAEDVFQGLVVGGVEAVEVEEGPVVAGQVHRLYDIRLQPGGRAQAIQAGGGEKDTEKGGHAVIGAVFQAQRPCGQARGQAHGHGGAVHPGGECLAVCGDRHHREPPQLLDRPGPAAKHSTGRPGGDGTVLSGRRRHRQLAVFFNWAEVVLRRCATLQRGQLPALEGRAPTAS